MSRVLALLVTVVMIMGMLPVSVFAAEPATVSITSAKEENGGASANATIAVGQELVISLTNGSSSNPKNYTVTSGNTDIATVTENASFQLAKSATETIKVEGIAAGETTITMTGGSTYSSGGDSVYVATINLTVVADESEGGNEGGSTEPTPTEPQNPGQGGSGSTTTKEIALTAKTSDGDSKTATIAVGEKLTVKLTNGSTYSDKTYTIANSVSSVASVASSVEIAKDSTEEIEITGLANGVTTITFSSASSNPNGGTYTATLTLTVGTGESGGSGSTTPPTTDPVTPPTTDPVTPPTTDPVTPPAGDSIVVVAASDMQAGTGTLSKILDRINNDYPSAFGALMCGDYSSGSSSNGDMTSMDSTFASAYPNMAAGNRIYLQGNHDSGNSSSLITSTGAHDTTEYGVYAINYSSFSSAASGLKSYLTAKVNSGYAKPIFVLSHQPLHETSRSDKDATDVFDALNEAGEKGLNIIFLFGHNHSSSYDDYLGGGSIYLKKGDTMTVKKGGTETLAFTYMNPGYVGYNYGNADKTLTMSVFEIFNNKVIITRYDENGTHVLKAEGKGTSGYTANTKVYPSPQTVTLTGVTTDPTTPTEPTTPPTTEPTTPPSSGETVAISITSAKESDGGASADATITVGQELVITLTNGSSSNSKDYTVTVGNASTAEVTSSKSFNLAKNASTEVKVKGLANGTTTVTMTGSGSGSAYVATINLTVGKACEHKNVETLQAVAATCTATGLTEGKKCSDCGATTIQQTVIPALGHDFEDGVCSVCGAEKPNYGKVDAPVSGKQYIIAAGTKAMIAEAKSASSGSYPGMNGTDITVEGDTVVSQVNNDMLWEVIASGNGYILKSVSEGKYVKASYSSSGSSWGGSTSRTFEFTSNQSEAAVWTISGTDVYVGSGYLTYYSGSNYNLFTLRGSSNKGEIVFYEAGAGCEHKNTETLAAVEATCTATGLTAGEKCSDCGYIITAQTEVAKKAHDSNVTIDAVEATCTTTGLSEGKKCSVCQTVTVEQTVIAAKGHTFGNGNTCSVCGAEKPNFGKVDAPVSGMQYIIAVGTKAMIAEEKTANNGSYPGMNGTDITVENDTVVSQVNNDMLWEVIASGDSYILKSVSEAKYVKASYTGSGSNIKRVFEFTDSQDEAAEWTISGTDMYVGNGYLAYYASNYNLFTLRGSNNKSVVVFYEAGAGCEHKNTETLAAVEATCTETGLTAGEKCSDCGYVITEQTVIPALGHKFEGDTCSVCGTEKAVSNIGITSDMHDETTYLKNWLTNVQAAIDPDMEYMVYGGDFTYNSSITSFNSAVSLTNQLVGQDKGIYTTGNHEYDNSSVASQMANTTGFKRIGLAVDAANYKIFNLGAASNDHQTVSFSSSDMTTLENYLKTAPTDKPIFVISHYPLHYISSRSVNGAEDMINLLNNYSNVIFLWGHNHSQSAETHYGEILVAGDSIQYTSSKSQKINFTYANAGTMNGSQGGYYGMIASVSTSGDSVTMQYYNANGKTVDAAVTVSFAPHVHDAKAVAKTEATCTAEGMAAHYYCSCGKYFSDAAAKNEVTKASLVIAKTAHTEVTVAGKAATCTATGLTEGKKCSVCNTVIVEQTVIPALGHNYGADDTCTVCGAEKSNFGKVDAPVGGMQYIIAVGTKAMIAETKTSGDYPGMNGTDITVEADTVVSEVQNNMLWEVIASNGKFILKSVSNGKYLKASYTSSGSSWGGSTTRVFEFTDSQSDAAEWTISGTDVYVGSGYLAYYSGSNYNLFTLRGSSNKGEIVFYEAGAGCEHKNTETLAAVEATCTTTGLTAGEKCSDCGYVITAQTVIPAKGHNYVDDVCTACGAEKASYGKVDAPVGGMQYIIASGTKAMIAEAKTSGDYPGMNGTDITVESDTVVSQVNNNMLWEVIASGNGYILKSVSTGQYLKASYSSSGSSWGGSTSRTFEFTSNQSEAAVWTISGTDVYVGSGYLTYYSGSNYNLFTLRGSSNKGEIVFYEAGAGCAHKNTETLAAVAATCTTTGLTAGEKCSDCGAITVQQTVIPAKGHNYGANNICTVCGAEKSNSVVVIAGSDAQSGTTSTMTSIMNQIKKDYASAYGVLMAGDYSSGYSSNSDMTSLENAFKSAYPEMDSENRIYVRGNHDSSNSSSFITTTGAHDTDYYGVYAINYDTGFGTSSANALKSYLDKKIADGYSKPIFVVTHQPLHKNSRNDNNSAINVFNVLNDAGEAGLNIIFMFGHNHSSTYDDYIGGGSIFLPVGDEMMVAGGGTETLNFVYMNSGYVGYCRNTNDNTLTMTAFEITDNQVTIKRYDTNGTHVLKAAGTSSSSSYPANTKVYQSPQSITLISCEHKNLVTLEAVAATCSTTGLTEGKKCSDCGTITVKQNVVEKLAHTEEVVAGKAATCTEAGISDGKKCTVCGTTTVAQETIPAKGHTEETIAGKAATCTEAGISDGKKCTVCGTTTVAQEPIPAKGHTEVTVAGKAATCTEAGISDGKKCSVCGVTTVAQETIPATGHVDANKDYVCDKCDEDLCTEHDEETVAGKAATCTETGLTEGKRCKICGEVTVEQKEIAKLAHTEVIIVAINPTCITSGLTEGKKCSVCDTITVAQETVPAKGHTEVTIAGKAATCTETGLTDGKECSVCNETLVEQTIIAMLAHTEVTVAGKAPTCTEAGLTDGTKCSVCDQILIAQSEIAKLAHTEEVVAGKAATCTETGLTEGKKCSVCGEVTVEQTVIAMIDHAYENGECTVCGKADPDQSEEIKLSGATATLGETLAINFVIDTAKLSGDGHTAIIQHIYADGSASIITIAQKDWAVFGGSMYYFSFDDIAAKEMADKMIIDVRDKDGNAVISGYEDSLRDYAMRALAKEEAKDAPDAEKLTLYVDMLNYGAAAQAKFGYNTSDLANSQLTAAQQAYATTKAPEVPNAQIKGEGYAGSTLTLESEIQLNFVYNNTALDKVSYAVATWTDHLGNSKSSVINLSAFKEFSSTMTYIGVKGLVVADYNQQVTLTLYSADDIAVSTSKDSIGSYVTRAANAGNLDKMILYFGASAYASFH